MTADHPTREERYAAVLAEHRAIVSGDEDGWYVVCICGHRKRGTDTAAHVAAALVAADPAPAQPDADCDYCDNERRILTTENEQGDNFSGETEPCPQCRSGVVVPAHPDTALSDEEREALGDWWDSDWPADAPHVLVTLYATVERILAARAAQPVPAPEVSRGVAEVWDEACGSCGEPATSTITLDGQPMPACLRHFNHWRTPTYVVAANKAEALREAADNVPLFEFMLAMDIAAEVAPAQIGGWLRAEADRLVRDALGGERGEGA